MKLLLVVLTSALVLGCGGKPAPSAPKPDTTAQTGAICDTALDTTAAAKAAQPDTQKAKQVEPEPPKPRAEPKKVAALPKKLPKMWDFGSTTCLPCKTMKQILDPMMVDYKDKVDVRIINVYEEQALAQQARIQIIPTQVFYDPEGKELYRHVGVYPRDSIEARFKEFGFPVVSGGSAPGPAPATGGT